MSSSIEWTDETWNPTVGCSRVSPGCDRCYAMGVAHRGMTETHVGLTQKGERGVDWTGEVRCLPERLEVPLRWRKPRRVFVDSMSDLFHPDVPFGFLVDVFTTMADAMQHTFQVLTKRPQRMAEVVPEVYSALGFPPDDDPLPNVWLGTSIESDRYAFRANHLRATPAAVRFVSAEPLLSYLPSLDVRGLDWLIVGGESGPGARPMHREWARRLRVECRDAGVPFFYKQHGEWASYTDGELHADVLSSGETQLTMDHLGEVLDPDAPCETSRHPTLFVRVGKKAAGRKLDGRTWDEVPA